MQEIYLLLGSNEGDRQDWIEKGLNLISQQCGDILNKSNFYQTAAWGLEEQPDFYNLAVQVKSDLSPEALLECILNIEKRLGRERTVKWGQRTLDIDIIFYGQEVVDEPNLKVPHPYLEQRRFALMPMDEIASSFIHPVSRKTIFDLLQDCTDELPVKKLIIEEE